VPGQERCQRESNGQVITSFTFMIASPFPRGRYPRSNRLPHTLRLRMSNERAAANVSKLRSVGPAVMGEVPQRCGETHLRRSCGFCKSMNRTWIQSVQGAVATWSNDEVEKR